MTIEEKFNFQQKHGWVYEKTPWVPTLEPAPDMLN